MVFKLSLLYFYAAKQPKDHTQAFKNARKINTGGTVLASKGKDNWWVLSDPPLHQTSVKVSNDSTSPQSQHSMTIIQLLLPCSRDVTMLLCTPPNRPPWHNHHWALPPSHDLGISSFKYCYWQVFKQKAPFTLQLTKKLRAFPAIQMCGHLSGFFLVCTHKVLHKLSSQVLYYKVASAAQAPHGRVQLICTLPLSCEVGLVILQMHTQSCHHRPRSYSRTLTVATTSAMLSRAYLIKSSYWSNRRTNVINRPTSNAVSCWKALILPMCKYLSLSACAMTLLLAQWIHC